MNTSRVGRLLACLLILPGLAGCGLKVPEIKEAWDGPDGTREVEFEIKKRIYCDLKDAVLQVDQQLQFQSSDRNGNTRLLRRILPDDWGAQVSIALQVDESTDISAGATLTNPFENAIVKFATSTVTVSQQFAFAFGGGFSAKASRVDTLNPYYSIGYLRRPVSPKSVCAGPQNDPFIKNGMDPATSSMLIRSDLGIQKWLVDAVFNNLALASDRPDISPAKDPPDIIQLKITFIIVTSANASPTWKMVRFTANSGNAPLFKTDRIRTHSLIITIGPSKDTKAENAHLAAQIGQAVSSANQTLLQPR